MLISEDSPFDIYKIRSEPNAVLRNKNNRFSKKQPHIAQVIDKASRVVSMGLQNTESLVDELDSEEAQPLCDFFTNLRTAWVSLNFTD